MKWRFMARKCVQKSLWLWEKRSPTESPLKNLKTDDCPDNVDRCINSKGLHFIHNHFYFLDPENDIHFQDDSITLTLTLIINFGAIILSVAMSPKKEQHIESLWFSQEKGFWVRRQIRNTNKCDVIMKAKLRKKDVVNITDFL